MAMDQYENVAVFAARRCVLAPTVTTSPRSARCRRSSPPWRAAVVPEVGLMPSAVILVAFITTTLVAAVTPTVTASRHGGNAGLIRSKPFRWDASIAGEIHEITFL